MTVFLLICAWISAPPDVLENAGPIGPASSNPLAARTKRIVWLQDQPTDQLFDQLTELRWVRSPAIDSEPLDPQCPWHDPALTELLRRVQSGNTERKEIAPRLHELSRSKVTATRAVAAIALTHLELATQRELQELGKALVDTDLHKPVRCAAAYALAKRPDRLDATLLRKLYREWAVLDLPAARAEVDQVTRQFPQGEALAEAVFYALVRTLLLDEDYDPQSDPDILRSIESESPRLQRIAAIAFSGQVWDDLPVPLVKLLSNPDPTVRQAALSAVCRLPTPKALQVCMNATADQELPVRLHAIDLLARFPGEETWHTLSRLFRSESASVRQHCVATAAALGYRDLVRRGIDDQTQRVRAEAAKHLLALGMPVDDPEFQKLLNDRDPHVQVAAIQSLGSTSRQHSGPVLLQLLQSPSMKVRQAAQTTLAEFWPPAEEFLPAAPPPLRQQAVEELLQRWQSDFVSEPAQQRRTPLMDEPWLNGLLDRWVSALPTERQQLSQQILAGGPEHLEAISRYFQSKNAYPTSDFVEQVLAKWDPLFQQILDLGQREGSQAVALASQIRRGLTSAAGNWLHFALLVESIKTCETAAAWLALTPLLEEHTPKLAALLDARALSHPDKLVRESGWRRIANRAEAWHVELLQTGIHDTNREVRLAALDAAGFIPSKRVLPMLEQALHSADPLQRLAAASALHRHGHSLGTKELSRLCFDDNHHVRKAVCDLLKTAPGSDHQEALRILLRALGDSKPEVVSAAISALEEITGNSLAANRFGDPLTISEQANAWRQALKDTVPNP